eukprot:5724300-Amphidinium_carterae.6
MLSPLLMSSHVRTGYSTALTSVTLALKRLPGCPCYGLIHECAPPEAHKFDVPPSLRYAVAMAKRSATCCEVEPFKWDARTD